MSNPKERHYWSQLRAALTAGQWRSTYPAKAPNNTPLSWSELFRKFNKHCQGYSDIAETASQTQSIALLLSARYTNEDEDIEVMDEGSTLNGVEVIQDSWKRGRLDLGLEGKLPEERVEEAAASYEILKSMDTSQFDTIHLTLAYYAYALGNYTECITHISKVPELLQFQNRIPNAESRSQSLQVPSIYAPSTTSFAGSFASAVDPTITGVRDGRAWSLAETFRSLCLKGMSYEMLYPADPTMALKTYRSALPLFSILRSEFTPKSLPRSISAAGKAEYTLFLQLREMWRWTERLMWRAIVLSAKTSDVFFDEDPNLTPTTGDRPSESQNSLWIWLGNYAACSAYWPPTFRTTHRSTVYTIHLRALVTRFGVLASMPSPGRAPTYVQAAKKPSLPTSESSTPSRPPTSLSTTNSVTPGSATPSSYTSSFMQPPTHSTWMQTARIVAQDYRSILSASTTFPRSGERNVQVEEFVELCVKVWEAGGAVGEQVGWVIDILTWSQRLTFNSSRILRNLMRFYYLGSSPYLAKRTLTLYIQVVGKAWEASKEGVGEDMDEDARWVETLVFGARMLCAGVGSQPGQAMTVSVGSTHTSLGDDGTEGIDDVHEARDILEKARTRLNENDKRLVAEVLLAEAIVWGLLGDKGQDPLTRPANFDKAHACLLQSIQIHPSPGAYYHLALSFARRTPGAGGLSKTSESSAESAESNVQPTYERNLTQAIESAGHAVEESPKDVRYWHLLGLLLSATEKWEAAKEVLERGAELDDSHEENNVRDEEGNSESGDEDASGGESEDSQTVTQVEMNTHSIKLSRTNGLANSAGIPEDVVIDSTSQAISITTSTFKETTLHSPSKSQRPRNPISFKSSTLQSQVLLLKPEENYLPPASTLHHPLVSALYPEDSNISVPSLSIDQYPASVDALFEQHLQLRISQVVLMEVVEGPEGAEAAWLDIFSWVAEKRGLSSGSTSAATSQPRQSIDGNNLPSMHSDLPSSMLPETPIEHTYQEERDQGRDVGVSPMARQTSPDTSVLGARDINGSTSGSLLVPIGIVVSPAAPESVSDDQAVQLQLEKVEQAQLSLQSNRSLDSFSQELGERLSEEKGQEKEKLKLKEKEKRQSNASTGQGKPKRRSSSIDRENRGDTSKSKKVQQMLKGSVHKGRAGINAVSRRIGNGVGKNGVLRRSTSTPDFHAVLQPTSYQASSIHSRRRLSSIAHSGENTPTDSPPPPPLPSLPTSAAQQEFWAKNQRSARQSRLLSDLWLMSAATFRRLGKIEQAKGSIQEAEVKDENNPNVWVQLGLYYVALGLYQHAIDTLQKARFICSDDIGATVHLARLYLDPDVTSKISSSNNSDASSIPSGLGSSTSPKANRIGSPDVDLAEGMLAHLTKGRGWDVPEAWYFLAKAYGRQGRKEKERQALKLALEFSEKRGVRDIGSALGWCL